MTLMLLIPSRRSSRGSVASPLPEHSRDIAAAVADAEAPQRHHSEPPPLTKPNV